MPWPSLRLLLIMAAIGAAPAFAHHKQTPEIVPLTTTGDTSLPRLPTPSRSTVALAVPTPPNTWVVRLVPWFPPFAIDAVGTFGDNEDPAVSLSGEVVAWDTDSDPAGTGNPGRQIVVQHLGMLVAGPTDPTGTSANPSLDTTGERVAFESTGDLAVTGNAGARQIFVQQPDGTIEQLSRGVGTSEHPTISGLRGLIAFESTSAPDTGADTHVAQIWLGALDHSLPLMPITDGLAPSTNPVLSDDGQVVAFESRSDLAGTKQDTGVTQIFAYDVKSGTWVQVTNEPGGCAHPAVQRVHRDWRVTYDCGDAAYFYMLVTDGRFHVQTEGGDTPRINPGPAIHFVLVSTTADLSAGTGTTPGHQVYMVNLFKRPPDPVTDVAKAVWFPTRGIHESSRAKTF